MASGKGTGTAASASSGSTHSLEDNDAEKIATFVFQHGRRYLLADTACPLPCDASELHRQNLETSLATTAYGRALCSPFVEKHPPQRVLEVGCGTGYWSSLCHDYLAELGCLNVEFVGIDHIRIAPDLSQKGINWRFVQHDLRKTPFPFEDGQFDLVLFRNLSLVLQIGEQQERVFDDALRILRHGGVIEIWEVDHLIRALQPHPPTPPGNVRQEYEHALRTATFLISPATAFRKSQNKFLTDSNDWVQDALDRRKLSPTPCTRMHPTLLQEPDTLGDIGFRRVAIPFGELEWEREQLPTGELRRHGDTRREYGRPMKGSSLTAEQAALRQAALLSYVMFIEGMELHLKEVSGKNMEEWRRWWDWMMADLYENGGAAKGDCIEIGAYWARKK